jgi:hypothetical protein
MGACGSSSAPNNGKEQASRPSEPSCSNVRTETSGPCLPPAGACDALSMAGHSSIGEARCLANGNDIAYSRRSARSVTWAPEISLSFDDIAQVKPSLKSGRSGSGRSVTWADEAALCSEDIGEQAATLRSEDSEGSLDAIPVNRSSRRSSTWQSGGTLCTSDCNATASRSPRKRCSRNKKTVTFGAVDDADERSPSFLRGSSEGLADAAPTKRSSRRSLTWQSVGPVGPLSCKTDDGWSPQRRSHRKRKTVTFGDVEAVEYLISRDANTSSTRRYRVSRGAR